VSVYRQDDLVWCARCQRQESVGAVAHDGPYTTGNSHLIQRAEDRVVIAPAQPDDSAQVSESARTPSAEVTS
jgi:hypothetical protein